MSIEPNDSGFATRVVPNLSVRDGGRAVEFYKRAFGATEITRITAPDGAIVAEMAIDGARFFVADESPENQAGAREIFPVADKAFGFRMGRVADPSGHHWLIARPLAPKSTKPG